MYLELNNENINNEKFLKYFLNENLKKGVNRNGLKKIRFNKKSISITIENNFYFNDFFTKENLLKEILILLKSYIIENELNLTHDMDFMEYKFKKININYQRW